MNEYKIQLIKVDIEGDEYLLEESSVTPDEAIEYLLEIRQKAEQPSEDNDELDEQSEVPEPTAKRIAKFSDKPCCGSKGPRHKKDCPEHGQKPVEQYEAPGAQPWYFSDIFDYLKDEMSEGEIYEKMRMKITDAQFREAIQWAKSEII